MRAHASWVLPLALLGCQRGSTAPGPDAGVVAPSRAAPSATPVFEMQAPNVPPDTDEARAARERLVRAIAESGDVRSADVLGAMRKVPRHLFMPSASVESAYGDYPLPIGHGQTISQPTVVAIMTEALELTGRERVLEVGTGSGYQAAILSLLAADVYTIEIVRDLGEAARARLARLGYSNVHVAVGDGYAGWPEHAPFDRILLTAAPDEVPRALFDQLADGGVLVAPVGAGAWGQKLLRHRKRGARIVTEDLGDVAFVPMVH